MSTYNARAEWDDDGWWVITAPDVPGAISQCRRLDQAAENIAEAISLMVDQDVSPDHVTVDWDVSGAAGELAHQASELREKAERLAAEASEKAKIAVVELRGRKFSYRDIGVMTKMSYQRAQQIAEKGTKHSRKSGIARNRRSKVGG